MSQSNHITVYLPAYHHQVLQQMFAAFTNVNWHIFSPTCQEQYREENFCIHPVSHQPFLDSFASCQGVICNAGFETCAEAMYLGKKLLAIPIHKQYEQECNAAALKELGVMTLGSLQDKTEEIWSWLEQQEPILIDEIANPKDIVRHILRPRTVWKHRQKKVSSFSLSY